MSTDDASLFAASRAGDVAAFGQLIERYHGLVCAIAYSRTGDRVASEDIAQDTFLAAWRGLGELRDATKLRAWLGGIARNLAGKSLRTRRREVIDVDSVAAQVAGDTGPLDAMLTQEREAAVWAALEQVPETYREPLVLFYREQQSIKEVALGLGLSEDAAKQRLSRGRSALKHNVEQLVERTLEAGRPRKAAAAAAIIAAILGTRSTSAAAATASRLGRRAKLAAAGIAAGAVAAIAVFAVARSKDSAARATTAVETDAALAELRSAHEARKQTARPTPCTLHGTVTRPGGAGVAGAFVAVFEHDWQRATFEPRIVDSDAAGRWQVPALAPGQYTVSVSAPGLGARVRTVTCAGAGADHAFPLADAGEVLSGVVSDSFGGPIRDVDVWLTDPRRPSEVFGTRTHADGTYELRVARGHYTTLLAHPEYTLDGRPVAIGGATREDATLLPAATVDGTVVDATGTPVAGAQVRTLAAPGQAGTPTRWVYASLYASLRPVVTDASGTFRVRGLPPGTVRVAARAGGSAGTSPPVELALAESRSGLTVSIAPARSISGFVVARTNDRKGLSGVRVAALPELAQLALPTVATSDDAGYFELAGLEPGRYRLVALAPGMAPYVATELTALTERDVTDVLVAVDRGVTIRGTLSAAEGATVRLAAKQLDTRAVAIAVMTQGEVDERGAFTFAAVAPGDYILEATTYDRSATLPIHVTATEQTALQLALEPRPAITGRVIDDRGTPLAGALVVAEPDDARARLTMRAFARTDLQGAFSITNVHPGTHEVRVFDARGQRPWARAKRPFAARDVEVPARGSVVEQLEVASGGARITGTVVGADRKPLADVSIEVRADDSRRVPGMFARPPIVTDDAGRFTVDGLFGEAFDVEASSSDGTQRAVATAGPGAEITLELAPMQQLAGSVRCGGAPVATFDVTLVHARAREYRTARGANGDFAIAVLAGDHDLSIATACGYAKQTITAQDGAHLDLELTAWASVRGRVLRRDGTPVVDASVELNETVGHMRTVTDRDGRFVIERAVAGPNQLSIRSGDAASWVHYELELASGQQLDLETIRAGEDLRPKTTRSTSAELGLQMYVAVVPPTDAQLAKLATDPIAATREASDPKAALWVAGVTPGSPAAIAGLRRGDRIVGVGRSQVGTGEDAAESLMALSRPWRSKGREVPWTVIRDGRELRVELLVRN